MLSAGLQGSACSGSTVSCRDRARRGRGARLVIVAAQQAVVRQQVHHHRGVRRKVVRAAQQLQRLPQILQAPQVHAQLVDSAGNKHLRKTLCCKQKKSHDAMHAEMRIGDSPASQAAPVGMSSNPSTQMGALESGCWMLALGEMSATAEGRSDAARKGPAPGWMAGRAWPARRGR